ncbi:hypothetical protein RYX36_018251 [Vicia faba]
MRLVSLSSLRPRARETKEDFHRLTLTRPPSLQRFRLSVSVSAQQSAFVVGVPSDLYAFHRSTGNSLCPYRTLAWSLGLVSVPVWLIILSDQLLIIALGRFLRVTHPSATGNTTSRPTCMCKACRQRSS